MWGLPFTRAFSAKRASSDASSTIITAGPWIVWPQKACSRGVWRMSPRPTVALNHWRSLSTRVTAAIGVAQMKAARRLIASKLASRAVSRMP